MQIKDALEKLGLKFDYEEKEQRFCIDLNAEINISMLECTQRYFPEAVIKPSIGIEQLDSNNQPRLVY